MLAEVLEEAHMADTATLRFAKEKETKNTIRYQEQPEEGQPPIIGTLYVAKFWARGADRLTVTLTKGEAE
jgi:hypothetical protein